MLTFMGPFAAVDLNVNTQTLRKLLEALLFDAIMNEIISEFYFQIVHCKYIKITTNFYIFTFYPATW